VCCFVEIPIVPRGLSGRSSDLLNYSILGTSCTVAEALRSKILVLQIMDDENISYSATASLTACAHHP
jgi:hypothetical protein